MHWLLFIHKILFLSTCFEHQVLIFRGIELYTCNIWYCHSLWEFVVACRYTAWVRTDCRGRLLVGVLRHCRGKVVGGCLNCRGKSVGGCLKTPTNNLPLQSVLTQAVYRQATVVYPTLVLQSVFCSLHYITTTTVHFSLSYICVLRHPPTTFSLHSVLTQAVYRQATKKLS